VSKDAETRKIDVTSEAHAAAHTHVKGRSGVSVKSFVSALILDALSPPKKSTESRRAEPPTDDAWEKPAFWDGREEKP